MLPVRSAIQTTKTVNPGDEKILSSYQDQFSVGSLHGNSVNHYGNSAYLSRHPALSYTDLSAKPFITPSYRNLTSESYIGNRFSDNYSNNYKTSEDNVLIRPINTAPTRTKLQHLFEVKIAPIAKVDKGSAYGHDFLNGRVNDHFVSKKLLKTDTVNLRDSLVNK